MKNRKQPDQCQQDHTGAGVVWSHRYWQATPFKALFQISSPNCTTNCSIKAWASPRLEFLGNPSTYPRICHGIDEENSHLQHYGVSFLSFPTYVIVMRARRLHGACICEYLPQKRISGSVSSNTCMSKPQKNDDQYWDARHAPGWKVRHVTSWDASYSLYWGLRHSICLKSIRRKQQSGAREKPDEPGNVVCAKIVVVRYL